MFLLSHIKRVAVFVLCVVFIGGIWNIPAYGLAVDQTPPTVNLVKAESSYELSVNFNEAVDRASAETATNYTVSNGVGAAAAASLGTDGKTVSLRFSTGFKKYSIHKMTVSNVKDIAGNAVKPTTRAFVSAFEMTEVSQASGPVITGSKGLDTKTVLINFNCKLDKELAEMPENYTIVETDENVKAAKLNEDGMSVTVTLPDNLTKNYKYCILVRNIKDTADNLMHTGAALFSFPPVVGNLDANWWDSHKDLMFSYNHMMKLQHEKERNKGDDYAIRAIEGQQQYIKIRFDSSLRGLYEYSEHAELAKKAFDFWYGKNTDLKGMRPDSIAVKGTMLKFANFPIRKDGAFYIADEDMSKISGIHLTVDGNKVVISKNTVTIEMNVGSTTVNINEKQEDAGICPILVNNHIFVPIQYVGEKLGYMVELKPGLTWQSDTLLLDDTIYPEE